mgnify:CR=1 FL=1
MSVKEYREENEVGETGEKEGGGTVEEEDGDTVEREVGGIEDHGEDITSEDF